MGSCISKCSKPRKKKFKQDQDSCPSSHVVQDKLVISQDQVPVPNLRAEKPASPTPSSSFTCSTTTKCTGTTSSSSSCSSVKDRSFTNEFLWSCIKDNPHIVGINPRIEKTFDDSSTKIHPQCLDPYSQLFFAPPHVSKPKQALKATTITVATPKKRARASSPTLVRQKSFRRDQNFTYSTPNRGLRSPSPSQRFNGNNNSNVPPYQSPSRRHTNGANCAAKRESFRAPTTGPALDNLMMINRSNFPMKTKDQDHVFCQRISTKIDGVVGDVKRSQEMDAAMAEDINNPHIALDCFIFL